MSRAPEGPRLTMSGALGTGSWASPYRPSYSAWFMKIRSTLSHTSREAVG